jgi:hypothetical protein
VSGPFDILPDGDPMPGREPAHVVHEYLRHIPMGRGVTLQEIAATVAFLASPEAGGITGGYAWTANNWPWRCPGRTWARSTMNWHAVVAVPKCREHRLRPRRMLVTPWAIDGVTRRGSA